MSIKVQNVGKGQSEERTNHSNSFVNISSQEILNASFSSSNTSCGSIDLSMSSSDDSFASYAASSSGSLTNSSIAQSWLYECRDPENEQKFSLEIETDPKILYV